MRGLTRKLLYPFLVIATLLLGIGSCANEGMPTGGTRDSTPPSLVKSIPANESTNFKDKEIKLYFDEYITNPINSAEIWVTPEISKKPDFLVEGKHLTIKLKDTLQKNTTYNIGFGKAIQDVTEKNTLTNFSFTFATGDSVDKALISGASINTEDLKPIGNITIGLYNDSLFTKKPTYYTKSDEVGNWLLKNVKKGDYWIAGFDDKNGSKIYDYGDGAIGFQKEKIALEDTISRFEISLFLENDEVRLKEIVPRENFTEFVFSKPLDKINLTTIPKNEVEYAVLNNSKDTLRLWYKNTADSVQFTLNIKDSTTTKMVKTANAKDSVIFYFRNKQLISPALDFELSTNNPIATLNPQKIKVLEDSTRQIENRKIICSKLDNSLKAVFPKNENARYVIVVGDSAVQDIFGNYNKETILEFKTGREVDYGNLLIKNKGTDYLILEVLDTKDNVVQKAFIGGTEQNYTFRQLAKGVYKIMGVIDENKNGYWDVGSFKKRTQAEMRLLLKDAVEIKGGWDVEADIIIEKDENGIIKRAKREKADMGN